MERNPHATNIALNPTIIPKDTVQDPINFNFSRKEEVLKSYEPRVVEAKKRAEAGKKREKEEKKKQAEAEE